MKLSSLIILLSLLEIVKSAWWASAMQPVLLGFGAVFTALNQEILDVEPIELNKGLPFISK